MKIKRDQVDEMYGRMREACDLEMAIESGELRSLDDVLRAVRARSLAISEALSTEGFIGGRVTRCPQQEMLEAQREVSEPHAVLH